MQEWRKTLGGTDLSPPKYLRVKAEEVKMPISSHVSVRRICIWLCIFFSDKCQLRFFHRASTRVVSYWSQFVLESLKQICQFRHRFSKIIVQCLACVFRFNIWIMEFQLMINQYKCVEAYDTYALQFTRPYKERQKSSQKISYLFTIQVIREHRSCDI